MKALLKRHFNELTSTLTANLKQVSAKGDKKSVHALRVTVKRLRALFVFLEYIVPKEINAKKTTRKLKKLFSEAGKLRTQEVQSALFKEFNKDDKAVARELHELKAEIHKQRKELRKEVEKLNVKKLLEKMNASFRNVFPAISEAAMTKSISVFSSEQIQDSLKVARKNAFHQTRKKLKQAHFVLEINKRNSKNSKLLKLIDPIEKETGRRQDLITAFSLLQKSREKRKESKAVRLMTGRIRQEMKSLNAGIRADCRKLEKKVKVP